MNEKIKKQIEDWVREEDMQPRAGLKVLKRFDPYEGIDEDEIEAYLDFRSWYMGLDFELLKTIPKPVTQFDFWAEPDDSISFAFGSMDFERLKKPFDKYHYKLKMIYKRVKDLAETYSCINGKDRKQNTYQRFQTLVEKEFKDQADLLLVSLKRLNIWVDRAKMMKKITQLNCQIKKCNQIWEEHSFQE
jgi:hypothetical protein